MATRKRNGNRPRDWGFNFATVVQVFAIPVLSAIIYLIVQWVTQGDTLRRHEVDIVQNQKDIKEEAALRDKNRVEFLDKLGRVNETVNSVDKNVAIQGQVLGQIKDELSKRK